MNKHSLISIDIAKSILQVCAITRTNKVSFKRGVQKAYIAMAARIARIAWTLLNNKKCINQRYKS